MGNVCVNVGDEAEAAGLAANRIPDNLSFLDLAVLLEVVHECLVGQRIVQPTDKNLVANALRQLLLLILAIEPSRTFSRATTLAALALTVALAIPTSLVPRLSRGRVALAALVCLATIGLILGHLLQVGVLASLAEEGVSRLDPVAFPHLNLPILNNVGDLRVEDSLPQRIDRLSVSLLERDKGKASGAA